MYFIPDKGGGTMGARGATAPAKVEKGLSPPPSILQSITLYRPQSNWMVCVYV